LRRIDQRHAEINAELQCGHFVPRILPALAHAPSALAQDRHAVAAGQGQAADRIGHGGLRRQGTGGFGSPREPSRPIWNSLATTFAITITISTRMMNPSVLAGAMKVAKARPKRKPISVGSPAFAGSGSRAIVSSPRNGARQGRSDRPRLEPPAAGFRPTNRPAKVPALTRCRCASAGSGP